MALLGEIYPRAREVIIGLGEEEECDAIAFDAILKLENYFKHRVSNTDLMLDTYNSQEGVPEMPRFENTGWDAICQILRKRSFGRSCVDCSRGGHGQESFTGMWIAIHTVFPLRADH